MIINGVGEKISPSLNGEVRLWSPWLFFMRGMAKGSKSRQHIQADHGEGSAVARNDLLHALRSVQGR